MFWAFVKLSLHIKVFHKIGTMSGIAQHSKAKHVFIELVLFNKHLANVVMQP